MRRFALILATMTLAGCATLPLSGPVSVGGPILVDNQTEVEYLPQGPADGASQREILDGFLAAGAAPQHNFRIARQFLTDDLAQSWNPARETLVRGLYSRVESTSTMQMTLTTSINSRVDEAGVFTPVSTNKSMSFDFRFIKSEGQWRLAEVPDLSLITSVAFATAYDEYTVYFYTGDRTTLVPDVRVFARQGDPVTAVARAVIDGPSAYLPTVFTAFPNGSALQSAPVDTTGGRARVDVSVDVARASVDDQRAMVTEMATSLAEFGEITTTTLTVNNVPISVSPIPVNEVDPRVADEPLVERNGTVGYISGDALDPLGNIGARIANLSPVSISYDASSDVAAVGTRVGVYRVSDRTERVSFRPSLADPQIDDSLTVWWVDPHSPSRISAFVAGAQVEFAGPWPRDATVSGLEVSRENARLAVTVNVGHRSRLYVAAIEYNDGRPNGLAGFRSLPANSDTLVDVAWVDATHLAIIGLVDHVAHVEIISVGGRTTLLGQPQNPYRIVGGNTGVSGLVVLAQNNQLWKPRGAGWQSSGLSADVLATQH